MKVIYEKKYALSKKEMSYVDDFIRCMVHDHLPCTKCNACQNGKCYPHTIWDIDEDEHCIAYRKWAKKISACLSKFGSLEDEGLKKIIENKIRLAITEHDQETSKTIYMVAKAKDDRESHISRIGIDFNYRNEEDSFVVTETLINDPDISGEFLLQLVKEEKNDEEDGEFFDMPELGEEEIL